MKRQLTAILITSGIVVLWGAIFFGNLMLSKNYTEVYGTPKNIGAYMDFSDYDLSDSWVSSNTAGEWEFYYNEWIVTDGQENAPPDSMISLPGRWTGMRGASGEALPNYGYCSYRMTVSGIAAGTEVWISRNKTITAWRGFINGELCYVLGDVGKTADGTYAAGGAEVAVPYTVKADGEALEIVIETGYNSNGGLIVPIWIRTGVQSTNEWVSAMLNVMPMLMLGVLSASVIYTAVMNFGIYRRQKDTPLIFLILMVMVHYITTNDIMLTVTSIFKGVNYLAVYHINMISAGASLLLFFVCIAAGKLIKLRRWDYIATASTFIAALLLYILLWGRATHILCVLPFVLYFIGIAYRLFAAGSEPGKFHKTYAVLLFLLIGILFVEMTETFGLICFGLESVIGIVLAAFLLGLCLLFFLKVNKTTGDALRLAGFEREIIRSRQEALKSQIKPHFVFNSLTGIQSMYHESREKGDEGLTRFAKHLYTNIESGGRDLIPFSEELENVINYVELENMRAGRKIALITEVDDAQFLVPVLSLQPIIENAIKHSGICEKENGYVKISAGIEDGGRVIRISDNGNGFDKTKVRSGASGLSNVRDRFKYLLDASFDVTTEPGSGCIITVRIKEKDGDKT